MNMEPQLIEANLQRAAAHWRWLLFLKRSFVLGAVFCGLLLGLGSSILAGWLVEAQTADTLLILAGMGGGLAWLIIVLSALASIPERPWLAAVVEQSEPKLLDRLNTAVYLEKRQHRKVLAGFYRRITRQAQSVLFDARPAIGLPSARPWMHLLVFCALLVVTVFFYDKYSPWQRLVRSANNQAAASANTTNAAPLELAIPATNIVESQPAWGEVRISEPGRDLRVTKVDVVPLQIEAAANEPLQKISWSSTVNGAAEKTNSLPLPADPRYAIFKPILYLDELGLSDWDVLTYYAKANTERGNSFASDVYFLEVRPFREDLLKLPGGENGQAYQCLNELTALISRQQFVIRQTHQHLQRPPEESKLQEQDRLKLAEAEKDLGQATGHLYGKMAAEMENKPIGEALDHLANAEKSLAQAASSLRNNLLNNGQNQERTALAELIAARKNFSKSISDNPGAFADKDQEETPPTAESAKKLKEIAEYRNEAKAVQDWLQQTLERQRDLARRTAAQAQSTYPQLSRSEADLAQSLQDFREQHPQVFRPAAAEADEAQRALEKAAAEMKKRSAASPSAAQQASETLDRLQESVKGQDLQQQLANAYKLKEVLDQQIRKIGQYAQQPASPSKQQLRDTVQTAKDATRQLKQLAEQPPTSEVFGGALQQALSDENKANLDQRLDALQMAQSDALRQHAASWAKESLEKISQAFRQSQPQALQAAQASEALKPDQANNLQRGMSQLDSLIKQLEARRPANLHDQAKQAREALYYLQNGLRNRSGSNERAEQILALLERELPPQGHALDPVVLKNLLSKLENFSLKLADKNDAKETKPELVNIDPARLPPAYRERVQTYFKKLSEGK